MALDTSRMKVASTEKLSSSLIPTLTASIDAALAAGKLPVSRIYMDGDGIYTVMFATVRNRKDFPSYTGGMIMHDDFPTVVATLNAAAGRVPTILASKPVDNSDEIVVLVAYRTG